MFSVTGSVQAYGSIGFDTSCSTIRIGLFKIAGVAEEVK
jgi:hypothetical protein